MTHERLLELAYSGIDRRCQELCKAIIKGHPIYTPEELEEKYEKAIEERTQVLDMMSVFQFN